VLNRGRGGGATSDLDRGRRCTNWTRHTPPVTTDECPAPSAYLEPLLDRIGVHVSDVAVLSLASLRDASGNLHVQMGSVLFGTADLEGNSWPEWHSMSTGSIGVNFSPYHLDVTEWRDFMHEVDGWVFSRHIIPMQTANAWLTELLNSGKARLPGTAQFHAALGAPPALVSIFPHVESPYGKLMAMAGRPVRGWVHPIEPAESPASESEIRVVPARWSPVGGIPFAATLQLVGLSTDSSSTVEPPRGLLVGNLQRDAWIARMHGSKPSLSEFQIDIRLDPDRRAIWELVLDVEENSSGGETLLARRLRLSDVTRPAHGANAVTVALPTIGRGVTRRVRLYGLDNELLDSADEVRLIERIVVTVGARTGRTVQSIIGDTGQVGLAARLRALDAVEAGYSRLLASGLTQRVVGPGSNGRAALTEQLAAARGELLVIDSYFGVNAGDWAVLARIGVPIKVLTGSKAGSPPRCCMS